MKKNLTMTLSAFLLLFYVSIVLYIFFGVLHISAFANFAVGMAFEIIGFLILGMLILTNIQPKRIKTGFFVPLVMVTVIYTIVLDIMNMVCIGFVGGAMFFLLNFVLLFIYCLVAIPMYIMGKR